MGKFFFSVLAFLGIYTVADNLLYSFKVVPRTLFEVHLRHEAFLDSKESASQFYVDISEPTLFKGPVDFRTGALGNVLPEGGHGQCKVVFLGGSTTESRFMPENKRWPVLIGESPALRDLIKTYNFGVEGQSLHHSLVKYLVLIGQMKPQVVIVDHMVNDLGKALNGGYYSPEKEGIYSSYIERKTGFNLKERVRNVFASIFPFSEMSWQHISNRKSRLEVRKKSKVNAREVSFDTYFSRLRALKAFVESEGANLIIINEPDRARELLSDKAANPAKAHLERLLTSKEMTASDLLGLRQKLSDQIRAFAVKEKVLLVDAQAEFPKNPDYFYDAVHFTPAGSEAFARYITEKVENAVKEKCLRAF